MAERIKLGGLWQNKSKDGTDYLSGRLSPTVKILIFKNNYKQPGDNSPTHIMYLAPLDPDPNAQRGTEQTDSFFGGSDLNAASDDAGGGGGEDDFASAPVAAPARAQNVAPRPAGRSSAPAPQASRPMNAQSTNTRPTQNGAPQQAPRRQPAPPPTQADDISDFEDPFGE
ncbi:MAG: hypothetical protein H8F28_27795 [Fibrella sp.]|nr:hypothetical protein [Armatimonadota bacterium]